MRLLIYLLAMLTGFSAAEAARPVSAVPASVDAAAAHAYAAATIKVVENGQIVNIVSAPVAVAPSVDLRVVAAFSAIVLTTPVLRHDVILG